MSLSLRENTFDSAEGTLSDGHYSQMGVEESQEAPASRKRRESYPRLHRIRAFLLRLDVCWTLVFFVFLLCVCALTTAITDSLITASVLETWHSIQLLRIAAITQRIDNSNGYVGDMARAFLTLHLQEGLSVTSMHTLSLLCASLDKFDHTYFYRAFSYVSIVELNFMGCTHGLSSTGDLSTMLGFIAPDHVDNGTFLINSSTYEFAQPLQRRTAAPQEIGNSSTYIANTFVNDPFFDLAVAYYNGSIDAIPPRRFWSYPAEMPHLLIYSLPLGLVARGASLASGQYPNDFVQVRLDGSQLLVNYDVVQTKSFTFMVLINQTLKDEDPSVMANSWGQDSVSNNSVYAVIPGYEVTYLKTSNISDPLMRAALKRLDLPRLQQRGYNHTIDFQYKGALATVTALHATLSNGLQLPMVFVSTQALVTPPYRRIMDISNGLTAATVLLLTALFWWFVHQQLSEPLQRMTRHLHASLMVGKRALMFQRRHTWMELAEVRCLIEAYNKTMRQLREIDAFIPSVARREIVAGRHASWASFYSSAQASALLSELSYPERRPKTAFTSQVMSVVYITIRKVRGKEVQQQQQQQLNETLRQDGAQPARRGQHLLDVVQRVGRAAGGASSGPFATPESLARFVMTLRSLSELHSGTVHRLTPDSCIVHFGSSVRRSSDDQTGEERGGGRGGVTTGKADRTQERNPLTEPKSVHMARKSGGHAVAQDACSAVGFALALQQCVSLAQDGTLPDVRAIVDTSTFVCGAYAARAAGQKTYVALGRDVNRDLQHVPAAIEVGVAVTGETAAAVMADPDQTEVRLLPVEALCLSSPQTLHDGKTGEEEDNSATVVLYEALPAPPPGDDVAAWQAYARRCTSAFELMRSGDYISALWAYKSVAEIGNLAVGLIPRSLRREAAATASVDTVVSVQVERLMAECRRRIAEDCRTPHLRRRHVPLGTLAVLKAMPSQLRSLETPPTASLSVVSFAANGSRSPSPFLRPQTFSSEEESPAMCKPAHRFAVTVDASGLTLRCVLSDAPEHLRDTLGRTWKCPTAAGGGAAIKLWESRSTALGLAGTLATVTFHVFREVSSLTARKTANAADGPLSDELRSAIPVHVPTKKQQQQARYLFKGHQDLWHPNILHPLAISFSVEGGVVKLWEFCPGGSLRRFVHRYPNLREVSLARFAFGITSALSYLHERGMVHGSLSLDSIIVGSDGVCRLIGQFTDISVARDVFAVPRTCYVSPAMAAGHAPTAACDMFCYGLLSLEALTRQPAWRWADVDAADGDGEGGQCAAQRQEELLALMAEGGQAFSDAVLQGRVVLNSHLLESLDCSNPFLRLAKDTTVRCLASDPLQRPPADEAWDGIRSLLLSVGYTLS